MNKNFPKISFILLGFLCLLSSCDRFSVQRSSVSIDEEKPRLCLVKTALSMLPVIAQRQGFFLQQGISPHIQFVNAGKLCQDGLLTGAADFGITGDGPFTFLSAQKNDLRIIAFLQEGPGVGIFYRKDSGVRSIEDLPGKRLGYLPGSNSGLYFLYLLDHFGWKKSDFDLRVMQAPALPQALVSNLIDAALIWEPWGDQALEKLGTNGSFLFRSDLYRSRSLLLASPHGRTMLGVPEKLLRALIDAEAWLQAHPEEAKDIFEQELAFSRKVLDRHWPMYSNRVELVPAGVARLQQNFALVRKWEKSFEESEIPHFQEALAADYLRNIDVARVDSSFYTPAH
jgi:ABC-type nitrate/sulfonate/bicarbonate transport system substrate-binding protein